MKVFLKLVIYSINLRDIFRVYTFKDLSATILYMARTGQILVFYSLLFRMKYSKGNKNHNWVFVELVSPIHVQICHKKLTATLPKV